MSDTPVMNPTIVAPPPDAAGTTDNAVFAVTPVVLRRCTENVCVNGHTWEPTLQLVRCGHSTPQGWIGCGAPILARKMENCPQCGDIVEYLRLRTDHTPPVPAPSAMCIPGTVSPAEVGEIIMKCNHAAETEAQIEAQPSRIKYLTEKETHESITTDGTGSDPAAV